MFSYSREPSRLERLYMCAVAYWEHVGVQWQTTSSYTQCKWRVWTGHTEMQLYVFADLSLPTQHWNFQGTCSHGEGVKCVRCTTGCSQHPTFYVYGPTAWMPEQIVPFSLERATHFTNESPHVLYIWMFALLSGPYQEMLLKWFCRKWNLGANNFPWL